MFKHIELVITVGGKAGQGVLSSGAFVEKIISEMGLYTFGWTEYPSLIKGGHNATMVRVSTRPVMAPTNTTNIVIALDQVSIEMHWDEMVEGGVILYDSTLVKQEYSVEPTKDRPFFMMGVPLGEISRNIDKSLLYSNTAALGALHALLDLPTTSFESLIDKKYGRKSQKIVDNNIIAIRKAFEYVQNEFDRPQSIPVLVEKPSSKDHILMNGSQAIAYGALKAGITFSAAYPMTPATPVFDNLVKYSKEYDIVAKQAEDEISAICMTVGASYAGSRAMTMSSGGGFSLMVEALGFAGIAEIPLVVVEAMRGGPSTGLPTKTEQSDLRFIVHASQGEFPRVVLAPGDVEEAFYETQRAFNIADKYQLPVIIVSDKYLGTSQMSFSDFDLDKIKVDRGMLLKSSDELGGEEYHRFQVTKDGVSPRALPGTVGLTYKSGSDEHNELGEICEDPINRVAQMNKRMQKEKSLLVDLPKPKLYGPNNADVTLISWGSTKQACLEVIEIFKEQDISVNVLHFIYVYPLNEKQILPMLSRLKKCVVVENNYEAQFAGMLKEYVGFVADDHLLKYNGLPFYPQEIVAYLKKKFF